MCFSLRTSIISYSIGIVSAVFAFCTRQIVIGTLILAYAQMQLSEAFIWHGIDTKNDGLNKFGTSFGKYLLATHNIAIGIGILLSIMFISKRNIRPIDFIPVILGVLLFLFVVFAYYLPKTYPGLTFPVKRACNSCQNPDTNRLKWPYPHTWYFISYILSVIFLFGWIKPTDTKIFLLTIFTVSLFVSITIYPNSVGSVWCWSTSFIAPVIVLVNYYLTRNISSDSLLS